MKTVAIIIVRLGSTRLPGKCLFPLGAGTVLEWVTTRAWNIPGLDEVWVATSTLPQDDQIVQWCGTRGLQCFRGSETDVLSRVAGCAREAEADVVIRITGDCPFVDPQVIGEVVALRNATNADYCSNIDPPTYPDGLDCEAFTAKALFEAEAEATSQIDRDCVTQFISRNRARYKCEAVICPIPDMHKERWVLDTQDDYKLCQKIAEGAPAHGYLDILRFLNANPELRKLNAHHPRNERFYDALSKEVLPERSYTKSEQMLARAREIIPLGCQTFSKSYVQYPGKHPMMLTHGEGAYVFDVDGNRYVDLVGALLPNILGYRDPDVDHAIRRQINNGISFSLATELEYELASRLKKHIPCAEMVRFGKNGTDVTTAAVRLARAYTRMDVVITCSYNGWSDVFVGPDPLRGRGVPSRVADLTVAVGDAESALVELEGEDAACVIIDPDGVNGDLLHELRKKCDKYGALLIFDEVITGFRYGMGGVQGYCRVTPDLATFGKAIANGMPLSALTGKVQFMRLLEPPNNIFYSGTFGGETLSLAAGIACVDKMDKECVPSRLWIMARILTNKIRGVAATCDLPVNVSDSPVPKLRFASPVIANRFSELMAQNGVLIAASNNLCYAIGETEMVRILTAYDTVLPILAKEFPSG